MPIPDFSRADYHDPVLEAQAIEGEVVGRPLRRPSLLHAIVYGFAAALVGSLGYGLVAAMGVMISIVTIGIGWLVARAMMTATGGVGGRPYQIAAVALTYLASTFGELLHPIYLAVKGGMPVWAAALSPNVYKYLLFGPFLELTSGNSINGLLGLVIIGIGLRTAWRMAAGSPGFGTPGGPRMSPFGIR